MISLEDFKDLIGDAILDALEKGLANNSVGVDRAKEISKIAVDLVAGEKDMDQLRKAIKILKEKIPEARNELEELENYE